MTETTKAKLKEATRCAIDDLKDSSQEGLSDKPVYIPSEEGIEQNIINELPDIEVSDHNPESHCKEVKNHARELLREDYVNNQDFNKVNNRKSDVESYGGMIYRSARKAINYAGGFDVSSDHLESAVSDCLEKNFFNSVEKIILCPLYNIDTNGQSIPLNPNIQQFSKRWEINITNIEIKPISDVELCSILTSPVSSRSKYKHKRRTHVIRVDYTETSYNLYTEELVDMVKILFRISAEVDIDRVFETTYEFKKTHKFERFGIYDWFGTSGRAKTSSIFSNIEFTSENILNIKKYWNQYREYLNTSSDKNILARPIRRISKTFEEESIEDRILECALAAESTVVKDISSGYGSYLPIRAAILLSEDQDVEQVYNRFNIFYSLRNEIIHSDKKMENIEMGDIDSTPREFFTSIREDMINICSEYARRDKKGNNITQTNQMLDKRLIDMINNYNS